MSDVLPVSMPAVPECDRARASFFGRVSARGGWVHGVLACLLMACAMSVPTQAADPAGNGPLRGSGDLGIAVERAKGSLQWLDTSKLSSLGRIEGLGDLSHASAVFSRDARYAYVFGRDGGLTKVDMLTGQVVKRIIQSGNSIGGAISQDGRWIAAANYTPGGVKIFDAETLALVADIPTGTKVVGLEDVPGNRFVFSLWDKGETWIADLSEDPGNPKITRLTGTGTQPYDALISPDGRWYVAGLYGENGIAVLDMWNPEQGMRRVLPDYGRGEEKLPVYKMPHLDSWAMVGNLAFIPGVGRHEVVIVDVGTWRQVGVIPVAGQPVFVMAQPDGRRLWVNFAFPHYDTVQIIDVPSQKIVHEMKPGKAVLHMEFTPRGEQVWLSVRDANRLEVYDTHTFRKLAELPADAPSGIFFTSRAHRIGL
ncbi:MAG TPA: cytochrome D1 domain-containing protein [Thiobacillaceae bacterium]|nr:cytochrome D1 domain-containing protein [Thiobacillaceae bacterium]HNU64112.1 cytochrome D1 domain-containing protein [Thiobacillaceae bacterium]